MLTFLQIKKILMIDKSDDEESNLTKVLQRNPGERPGHMPAARAERDGRKADEHGFRAAHRTMNVQKRIARKRLKDRRQVLIARLRWVRPLQRRSAGRHLLRFHPVRVGRREVVTRFYIRLRVLEREREGGFYSVEGG